MKLEGENKPSLYKGKSETFRVLIAFSLARFME